MNEIRNVISGAFYASIDIGTEAARSAINGVEKIVTDPSALKKTGKTINCALKGVAHLGYVNRLPRIVGNNLGKINHHLSIATDFLEFYDTFENIIYWINPITKKSLDEKQTKKWLAEALKESFREKNINYDRYQISLKTGDEFLDSRIIDERVKTIADEIIASAFTSQSAFLTTRQFKKALKAELIKKDYREDQIDAALESAKIQQKSKGALSTVIAVAFTIADLTGNLLFLNSLEVLNLNASAAKLGGAVLAFNQKWNPVDLAKLAASIGIDASVVNTIGGAVFTEVLEKVAVGAVSIGLALVICYHVKNLVDAQRKINNHNSEDLKALNEARAERTKAIWGVATGSLDFMSVVAPMAVAALGIVNPIVPGALIVLAFASKSMGVIAIFAK